MKVDVTKEKVSIIECHQVTEGEYCVNECEFILPECFEGLTVTAVFNNIPVPLFNRKCYIPSLKKGGVVLGVYAYKKNGDEMEVVYSPKPTAFYVDEGSYNDHTATEDVPEISRYEEYCKMLADFCENLILQMDYVDRATLVQKIAPENTRLQVPSARAVYDTKKELINNIESTKQEVKTKQEEIQNIVSNAIIGSASGESVVVDDVSPVPHDLNCKLRRKNLSVINDTGEFLQKKDVYLDDTYPPGYYSISGIVENNDAASEKCLLRFMLDGVVKKGATLPKSVDGKRSATENVYIPSKFNCISFHSSFNIPDSVGKTARFSGFQLEAGAVATEYTPYIEYEKTGVIIGGKNLSSVENVQCDPLYNNGQYYKKVYLGYTLPVGTYSFSAMVTSTDTDSDKSVVVLLNEQEGETQESCRLLFSRSDDNRVTIENQKIENPFNCMVFYPGENGNGSVGDTAMFSGFQIEAGKVATSFTKYQNIQGTVSDAEGNVKRLDSNYPITTILSSKKGVLIDVSYNRDINKVIGTIEEKLLDKETA